METERRRARAQFALGAEKLLCSGGLGESGAGAHRPTRESPASAAAARMRAKSAARAPLLQQHRDYRSAAGAGESTGGAAFAVEPAAAAVAPPSLLISCLNFRESWYSCAASFVMWHESSR